MVALKMGRQHAVARVAHRRRHAVGADGGEAVDGNNAGAAVSQSAIDRVSVTA